MDTRARIDLMLDGIERDQGVDILFAVESGSRAWGFPSPDSDWDVRFIYVRSIESYLSLAKHRDVIELPIVDEFDVNGWDLRKALALLTKGHPVLLEWLRSPIIYRERPGTALLRKLAEKAHHRPAAAHHYRSLGRKAWHRYVEGRERVPLKKYLYCVRPAAALRWLRQHPNGRVPMDLPTLLAQIDLGPGLREAIGDLLAAKAVSSEMGEGAPITEIDAFILLEFAFAEAADFAKLAVRPSLIAEADELFLSILGAKL